MTIWILRVLLATGLFCLAVSAVVWLQADDTVIVRPAALTMQMSPFVAGARAGIDLGRQP